MKITIIGLGRVGLPLALMLEKNQFNVDAVDISPRIRDMVNSKKMPFEEAGCNDLLINSNIYVSDTIPSDSNCYILTVGTPLKQHIETDLDTIYKVIDTCITRVDFSNNPLFILRSTVAPNTCKNIVTRIESKTNKKLGVDFYLAMCPERIAEGVAIQELETLAQIIGAEDNISLQLASTIFSKMGVECVIYNTFIEAELAKLFSNIYRYINFAIPNYFLYIADHFGVNNTHDLLTKMKIGYSRNSTLPMPGFAAGTCVVGDTLINVFSNFNDDDKSVESNIIMKYQDLYDIWQQSNKELYTIGFNDLSISGNTSSTHIIKKILLVTKREYTGKMVVITNNNNKKFTCTPEHLLPVYRTGECVIVKASEIENTDYIYTCGNDIDISSTDINIIPANISYIDVNNINVYNIEIEDHEVNAGGYDGKAVLDPYTNIIHHNCLRKDFGMINEHFPQTDLLLQAYKINEFMPKFFVGLTEKNIPGSRIGILGYTFKSDVDDTRDTLVSKLIHYIEKLSPLDINICEPNLPVGEYQDEYNHYNFCNKNLQEVLNDSDIIFLAMNHTYFKNNINIIKSYTDTKIIIDIWNLIK